MAVRIKEPVNRGPSRTVPLPPDEKLGDPQWAWAAYEPDARRPWNLALAGHLYRRAAFGAGWNELQEALSDGPHATIDKLLRPKADVGAFNSTYDGHESAGANSVDLLRAWWLRRMIHTPHPLLEKMALFWHSYFATSAAAGVSARLMRQHVQNLRSEALGSFRGLLESITRDPAVFICLEAGASRKALPSENLVRPLMETFTLGPGQFTPADVQEAAKAVTGWFVLRDELRFISREHDGGVKHILGHTGRFTRDDVVQILLEHPATARNVVRKLYRWLVSETEEPNAALIEPLCGLLASDYDILKLVETMLRSNLFFSSVAYRHRIKCPVEFALGVVIALEGTVSTTQLAEDLAGLGQSLYQPPTVEGWPGGRYWINSATLVRRYNLSVQLLRGQGPYADKLNPWAVAQKHGHAGPESAAQFVLELLLQGDIGPDVHEALSAMTRGLGNTQGSSPGTALRGFTQAVVTLPEFHLA